MIREYGDMWSIYGKTDCFIVTTNSYIRTDGALVMGRGIAKQLVDRVPGIAWRFAEQIEHLGKYGLVISHGLIAFQVKYRYDHDAELELITYSTSLLSIHASFAKNKRFDMNFPGIGNGRLNYDLVLPIIETLPDNVHVWTFGDNP